MSGTVGLGCLILAKRKPLDPEVGERHSLQIPQLFQRNIHIHWAHGGLEGAGPYPAKATAEARRGHRSLIQGEVNPCDELVRQVTEHGAGFGVLIGHAVLEADKIASWFDGDIDPFDQGIQVPFGEIEGGTDPDKDAASLKILR
jgi:hypothetical protein